MTYVFEYNGALFSTKEAAMEYLMGSMKELVETVDQNHLTIVDRADDTWVSYESATGLNISGHVYRRKVK